MGNLKRSKGLRAGGGGAAGSGLQRPYAREILRRLFLLGDRLQYRQQAAAAGVPLVNAGMEGAELLRPRGEKVGTKTLYSWHRAYLDAGWRGLIDQRMCRTESDPRFLAEVRRLCEQGRHRPILIHDNAVTKAEQRGWRVCTLRETLRHIKSIKRGQRGASKGR